MQSVLFLCSGNYYRSRFCEGWFNHLAADRDIAWRADSRGLAIGPWNPGAIYHVTVAELAARGVDPAPYASRDPIAAIEADFERAAVSVAVKEAEHRVMMVDQFPDWADRIIYWHVHDLDCASSDEAVPQLAAMVEELVDRLASNGD